MVEHYRSHNYCYNCDINFADQEAIANHFKIRHYYLKCEQPQCYFVGLNNTSMKNHVTEKHSTNNNEQEAETNINIKSEVKIEIDENW